MAYSAYAPLVGNAATPTGSTHHGERVLMRGEMDADDVASKTAGKIWCTSICLGVFAPYCIPFFCFLASPCGIEDRMRRKLLGSQLILTESAVHYDVAEHESLGCCGYQTVGKESKSIPLSSITDVQIINPSSGCCACWNYGQLDIHTPSDPITGNSKHIQRTAEVVFPGCTNGEEFRAALYEAKKRAAMPVVPPAAMGIVQPPVDISAKLQQLMETRNAGGLTEEEFQRAKQKLLA